MNSITSSLDFMERCNFSDDQKKILTIIGSFLVNLIMGTVYTFGNVNTYLTSYIKKYVDPSMSYAGSIWVVAASVLGQGCLMMVGGLLENKYGPRRTAILASIIFCSFVALTFFTVKWSFFWVVISYGFLANLGQFSYSATLAAGIKWYPKKKGIITGVILCGYGLGAFIFNFVQTHFLNPQNVPPNTDGYFYDEEILKKVPSLFLLLGGVYFVIQMIGSMLLFTPPKRSNSIRSRKSFIEENKSLLNESITNLSKVSTDDDYLKDLTLKEAISTKEFYMMWLMFVCGAQAVNFINSLYKAFGAQFIADDHFLSMVGSISSIFNAAGRIFWGFYFDRTSFRISLNTIYAFLSILLLTLELTYKSKERSLYMVWICMLFFCLGGVYLIFPSASASVYGPDNSGPIYGLLYTAPAVGSMLGAFLIQTIFHTFGWMGTIGLIVIFLTSALLLMLLFPVDVYYLRRK